MKWLSWYGAAQREIVVWKFENPWRMIETIELGLDDGCRNVLLYWSPIKEAIKTLNTFAYYQTSFKTHHLSTKKLYYKICRKPKASSSRIDKQYRNILRQTKIWKKKNKQTKEIGWIKKQKKNKRDGDWSHVGVSRRWRGGILPFQIVKGPKLANCPNAISM